VASDGLKGSLRRLVPAAVLILLCACAGQDAVNGDARVETRHESLILFDGTTMAGWTQAGPGGFRLVDGVMQSYGGMGLLWYSERTFGDFVLELDWRVTTGTDNSGVFLRFPDPGDDPWVAVNRGYEVQIYDDEGGDPQKTGAVYSFRAPDDSASKPVGQWNHYRIRASGNEYAVFLNGVQVNQFTSTDSRRGSEGHIGLQNHDSGSEVQFRDIVVREL